MTYESGSENGDSQTFIGDKTGWPALILLALEPETYEFLVCERLMIDAFMLFRCFRSGSKTKPFDSELLHFAIEPRQIKDRQPKTLLYRLYFVDISTLDL